MNYPPFIQPEARLVPHFLELIPQVIDLIDSCKKRYICIAAVEHLHHIYGGEFSDWIVQMLFLGDVQRHTFITWLRETGQTELEDGTNPFLLRTLWLEHLLRELQK